MPFDALIEPAFILFALIFCAEKLDVVMTLESSLAALIVPVVIFAPFIVVVPLPDKSVNLTKPLNVILAWFVLNSVPSSFLSLIVKPQLVPLSLAVKLIDLTVLIQ